MVEWTAYVDESGKDEKSEYLVLAGIIASPELMIRLSDAACGFKSGLALHLDPGMWELHGQNIMHRFSSRSGARLNHEQFRYPNIRNPTQKIAVFNAIVNLVRRFDVDIFSISVPNKQFFEDRNKDKILKYAMTILFEYLEQFTHITEKVDTVHIISDYVPKSVQHKTATILQNSRQGCNTMSSIQTNHVTGIEYVDSRSSVLIQLSDILAYVINKHRNGDTRFEHMATKLMQTAGTDALSTKHTLVI